MKEQSRSSMKNCEEVILFFKRIRNGLRTATPEHGHTACYML